MTNIVKYLPIYAEELEMLALEQPNDVYTIIRALAQLVEQINDTGEIPEPPALSGERARILLKSIYGKAIRDAGKAFKRSDAGRIGGLKTALKNERAKGNNRLSDEDIDKQARKAANARLAEEQSVYDSSGAGSFASSTAQATKRSEAERSEVSANKTSNYNNKYIDSEEWLDGEKDATSNIVDLLRRYEIQSSDLESVAQKLMSESGYDLGLIATSLREPNGLKHARALAAEADARLQQRQRTTSPDFFD